MTAYLPYLTSFTAMLCYAVLPVIAKKMHLAVPPFAFIAVTMLVLMSLAALASGVMEKSFKLSALSLQDCAGLLLFGVVNFVGFSLFLFSISKIPVAQYQIIFSLSPLAVALLAVFFLKEPFEWRYLAGAALMGTGLYVALAPYK